MLTAIVFLFASVSATSPQQPARHLSGPRLAQKDDPSARADDGDKSPRLSWRLGRTLRVDLDGTFQGDMHRSYLGADAKAGLSLFELRRDEVGVKGKLFQRIEFEAARELTGKPVAEGKLAKPLWKDVNVNLAYLKNAQLTVGRFKVPFGLEASTGGAREDFVYHSLGADALAPGRDTGVMVHGHLFTRDLAYAAGVFLHDGDNARSSRVTGAGRTFSARMTATPLRRWKSRAGQFVVGGAVAVSGVSDDAHDPRGLRGRTVVTEDTFFHPVYVNGLRRRLEADVTWIGGPASVRAELTYVTDGRARQGFADEDLPDARYRAWYIAGTYRVTGTRYHGVTVVTRCERLWFDSVSRDEPGSRTPRAETILPSDEYALTLGANWTLNRLLAFKVNLLRESISDHDLNPSPHGGAFWSQVARVQFTL